MKEDYDLDMGWEIQPSYMRIGMDLLVLVQEEKSHVGRVEENKQASADVLFQYSRFVMACIGLQARPCDLRLHLMKEVSGIPTILKKDPALFVNPPDVMRETSSSGNSRTDKSEGFG